MIYTGKGPFKCPFFVGTCNKKVKRALALSLYYAQSPLFVKIFRKFDTPILFKGERGRIRWRRNTDGL
jgi:hypothetical protein